MTRYRHRQRAGSWWLVLVIGVAVSTLALTVLVLTAPGQAPSEGLWIGSTAVAILGLLAWLFGSLTVSITESAIVVRFGPGWPRRSISLSEVRVAARVRNQWWYGWGIRWTPHGWLWNIAGLEAVELDLADGRRTRVGTDEPDQLAAAINRAIGVGEASGRSR